jgi:hypothetical protein
MSIFASPHAIAARKTVTRCANCRHNEAIIADLQAWVADLRKSRDLALDAERTAGDAVRTEFGKFAATDSSRAA